MSHLKWAAWYETHPRGAEHATVFAEAAGQLLLICQNCGMSQTADDVAAGNPVAGSKKARSAETQRLLDLLKHDKEVQAALLEDEVSNANA